MVDLHGADIRVRLCVQRTHAQLLADQLFIAITGERFDAHDFVAELAGKAGAALVHKKIDCDLPQIVVEDTREALADFASAWRHQFKNAFSGFDG